MMLLAIWCSQVLFKVDGDKVEAVACCPLMSPGQWCMQLQGYRVQQGPAVG